MVLAAQTLPGWQQPFGQLVALQTQAPFTHVVPVPQVVPQLTDWPQLFTAVPHTLPEQAATLSGVQPQTFGVPPPPQV